MISLSKYFEHDFIPGPMGGMNYISTSPNIKLIKTPKKQKNKKDIIDLKETYNIIEESEKLKSSREQKSISNKIRNRPKGIIIQDSYNNPFLPIQPLPRLDTAKVDLIKVHRRFKELYSKFYSHFLPWHFCVELVEDRYTVFNTRPIDMKFPLTNNELKERRKENKVEWDEVTQMFFNSDLFDLSECIHILIIGDSNLDIYTKQIYEIIGRTCISPFLKYFKLTEGIFQRTFPLNLGSHFNISLLQKYVKR